MIISFRDSETEKVFNDEKSTRLPLEIQKSAQRKLYYLESAKKLSDLQTPPGNHLEKLTGKRTGQHSIRVNDQFRICFKWTGEGVTEVEITDYH
ncbi:MAG: type II toxin-antitoxin system RelE/ParE family toxin [Anaerolineaceae bacterium]